MSADRTDRSRALAGLLAREALEHRFDRGLGLGLLGGARDDGEVVHEQLGGGVPQLGRGMRPVGQGLSTEVDVQETTKRLTGSVSKLGSTQVLESGG